jgi:O-antigen/teichoic acid export membrane protein
MVLTSVVLSVVLRRRLEGPPTPAGPARARRRSLLDLLGGARIPVVGLTLLALLQNVDVIVVRHQLGGSRAGSYAAAAVAAKAVVWVAVGIGLHLLPEVTRRAQVGVDPRPVLLRALVGVIVVATPALVIFALAPHLLLRLAFGSSLTQASSALVVLGAAMTLLAAAYLVVQYMLALGRTTFLWVLGPVALAEPFLLTSGNFNLLTFATLVLVLQAIAALALLTLGLRDRALRVLPAGPAPR